MSGVDKLIVSHYEEGKVEEVRSQLKKLSQDEILKLIDVRVQKGKGDPVILVRAILSGCPENEWGQEKRLMIFKHCIQTLQGSDLHSKLATELLGLLMLEMDSFSSSHLGELAEMFLENIKKKIGTGSKALELFPKVLSALAAQETVEYKEKSMSGTEYKSHVLNSLCSGRWDASSVIHLAAMFKDVPMTTEELGFVIDRIVRMFGEVDLQELPPLVYQLLRLMSKGHEQTVLEGLKSFFVKQDKISKEAHEESEHQDLSENLAPKQQLRQVEGTVILHITFAMKQDQDLAREFIKLLKNNQQNDPTSVLAPFSLALALSVAQIQRFQEQVYELLKVTILKCYKDRERKQDSAWVREMFAISSDVAHHLTDTVHNCVSGWDHITQGLVQLGFLLMDSCGPRVAFGKVTPDVSAAKRTPTQNVCRLGADILLETMMVHEMVRSEILGQILNRIVTKGTSSVTHFLDLLLSLVKSTPQFLLESVERIRESLDYLSYLPVATAEGLLKALLPLVKISVTLKDALILILRKAMFSRNLETRKVAVTGFLLLLQQFKVLGGLPSSSQSSGCSQFSLSQVTVDVHMPHNAATNEALCLEILGNLQRSLTQQADVRLTLYQGLFDVLCKNMQLKAPILSILYRQLRQYYEANEDVQPPLKLQPCTLAQGDQVYLAEPLGHLLLCLAHCLMKSRDANMTTDDDSNLDEFDQTEVDAVMESLVKRMVTVDLEDFELDKSADFSLNTGVGVKNNIFATLVMQTLEILMEYTYTVGEYSVQSCQRVVTLYQSYQKLVEAVSGKGSNSTKKSPKSLLSIKFVTNILHDMFSDQLPDHQEGLDILRDNITLQRYCVSVSVQRLQQMAERCSCDGPEGNSKEKLFSYCCTIAKVLLQHYVTTLQGNAAEERERHKQMALLCLEGFAVAVTVVTNHYPESLTEFLNKIDTSVNGGVLEQHEVIHKNIKSFQRMVMAILTSNDDDCNTKEAVSLLQVIGHLAAVMSPEGQEFAQVQHWAQQVCMEQSVDDLSVVKCLLQLLFSLTTQMKSCVIVTRDLCQDVHSRLGDIDQEVEIEDRVNFSIVTQRNAAPTVFLAILNQYTKDLEDTDWVINALRTQNNTEGNTQITQAENQEKSVCTRLGQMINGFHELIQSAIPVGPCMDGLVKSLTQLYTSLTLLVKFYLNIYRKGAGHLSPRFEKLVKLSGSNLTQLVYAMITYIQASQSEHLQQTTEKSIKKNKKITTAIAMANKAKVLKQTKAIPSLIFAIEQYEKFLIQLTKKSKVNLMEHMKMSTSRDFRINAAALQQALQEQADDDDSDNEDNDTTAGDETQGQTDFSGEEEGNENEPPSKKRANLSSSKAAPPAKKKLVARRNAPKSQ